MKNKIGKFFLFACIVFFMASCLPESNTYDASLLIGKWKSGTLYYRYDVGGSGATWDTADDVTESEAQKFNWTLDQSSLTHIYIMETGGYGVPKIYKVTELSATVLKYEDEFGKSFSFSKIN